MNIRSRRIVDIHADLISGYLELYPQARVLGFEREMRAWAKRHRRILKTNLEGRWNAEQLGFRPDAFIIDEEASCVVLVEAENTSRITKRKWEAIADFAWLIDGAEWTPVLHVVDRSRAVRVVELLEVAIAHLAGHAPKGIEYLQRLHSGQAGYAIWTPDTGFIASKAVAR